MGLPYLGRLDLRWCTACDVPLIGDVCDLCESLGKEVRYAPPGDIRPAFEHDMTIIKDAIKRQFDPAYDPLSGRLILLNKVSSLRCMEEVIAMGRVLGTMDHSNGHFMPRPEFAALLSPRTSAVEIDPGAVSSVLKSSNVMVPGIVKVWGDVKTGDEVVVVCEERIIATGRSRISSGDLQEGRVTRGVGVKVRHRLSEKIKPPDKGSTWSQAVEANRSRLEEMEAEAVRQIRTVWRDPRPKIMSFSGGKDSLATLLLVLEAGFRPPILFVDTGLEMRETLDYVRKISRTFDLDLLVASAGDAFYRGLRYFGPPAKDYRWCCKTNKLGPTARYIREHYPDGVVSFIGQRSFESEQRARKGRYWVNPWVPSQTGFSPIQNWNALHVWLYLMWKGVEINPWYRRGLDRIGCCICPASDLEELKTISRHEDLSWWWECLRTYARHVGLPEDWAEEAWMWRRVKDPTVTADRRRWLGRHSDAIRVILKHEDAHLDPPPTGDDTRLLHILGHWDGTRLTAPEGVVEIAGERVRIIKGDRHLLSTVCDLLIRGHSCVGCGICTARCRTGALHLLATTDGNGPRVQIEMERCTRCRRCLGPCPVVDLHPLRYMPAMR